MKKKLSQLLALLLLFAHAPATAPRAQTTRPAPDASQQPAATPQQPTTGQPAPQTPPGEDSDEDVVRITSNLVQFDTVVTDKQGRLVTDLRPEDFEVFVGGRKQEITNFSFVLNETAPAADGRPAKPAATPDKTAPPLPPVPLRPSQVRRTIALVVDDLGTSFEDIVVVRRALKKFVDEQMQPGDLVAITRTSAGVGALQQFTSDKRMLYRAIEHVRWNPQGRSGINAFTPIDLTTSAYTEADPANGKTPGRGGAGTGADDENGLAKESTKESTSAELEEFRQGIFAVGTLGALNFLIRGMSELPGRKSVLVFSDGFKIYPKPGSYENTTRLLEGLRRLTEQANRASVVIYTVDARGLACLCLTAADNLSADVSPAAITGGLDDRKDEFLTKQEGLAYLAHETGGLFIRNTNDLGGGVRRVLEDQRGYYLIGFRPSEEVFDPVKGRARFNKFEVRVKRAGLNVRTRAGFFGYTDREMKAAVPHTRSEQLISAIASPLTSGDLTLKLTSLFNNPAGDVRVVNSLMLIDMSQFKFVDEPEGWKKAVVDVVAVTFGENGQVVDEVNRTETLRARADGLARLTQNGLVYLLKVPVKKPGAYQLRVAVRDATTEKLGSASQFVEVPDLKKNRLALSGLFMVDAAKTETMAAAVGTAAQGGAADHLRDAALRRFRGGTAVDFFYDIYNARTDRATGRPQLQTQSRLFRDGKLVFSGTPQPYSPDTQADLRRLPAASRIQLGAQMAPGEYVLQVVVTDLLAKGKDGTATQWIDFEVVQ
jgi:VWFA-related protein